MADMEEKFFVISIKDITDNAKSKMFKSTVHALKKAVKEYNDLVNLTNAAGVGKQFYVCNKDEPYAEDVISTILHGEEDKERT